MSIKKNKKESAKNLSYKYLTLSDDKNMKQILIEKRGKFNESKSKIINNRNENSLSIINKSKKKISLKKESNKNIKEAKNELPHSYG